MTNIISKFAEDGENKANVNTNTNNDITYHKYFSILPKIDEKNGKRIKINIDLVKKTVKELKIVAKYNNLRVGGVKMELIERIHRHFSHCIYANIIQRNFRKYIVLNFNALRGNMNSQSRSKLCVNESDFYTLEPLDEMEHKIFCSLTDEKQFTYGFDINSLITLFKKQRPPIQNPYNREPFTYETIQKIVRINLLYNIIFNPKNTYSTCYRQRNIVVSNNNPEYLLWNQRVQITGKINEIRNKPLSNRINDLFMEIDLLGNYTQSSWFMNLHKQDYLKFYTVLHYLWYSSGIINYQLKREITPFYDPFTYQIERQFCPTIPTTTLEQSSEFCISIMENFVYGGIEQESRKLGILHLLSVLTIVSVPARENLFWLYDSIQSIFPPSMNN
jgi:hypothetical protein